MSAAPLTVVIAGAGLTGLVAAHQLRRGLGPVSYTHLTLPTTPYV